MDLATVADLSALISNHNSCGCCYQRSVRVRQEYKGRVLWEGEVGVFKLFRSFLATECYAWFSTDISGTQEPVIMLKFGKVDSAKAAVETYILQLSEAIMAA